jgi:hypothetical protein
VPASDTAVTERTVAASPALVSAHLVHKSSADEVLLAQVHQTHDDTATVVLNWPHNHRVFRTDTTYGMDTGLVIESVRQASMLLIYRRAKMSLDHQVLLNTMTFELLPPDPAPDAARTAPTLTIRLDSRPNRTGRRIELSSEAVVTSAEGHRARVTMSALGLDPAWYARMRRTQGGSEPSRLPTPAPASVGLRPAPGTVGRDRAEDVVIAGHGTDTRGTREWWLDVLPEHPTFLDHAADHVQGIALVEAVQQVARATVGSGAGSTVTSMDLSFLGFAELDVPLILTAEPAAAPPQVTVVATQAGAEVVRGRVGFGG